MNKIIEMLLTISTALIISITIFLISSIGGNIEAFNQNPLYKFDTMYIILFTIKTLIFIFIFHFFIYLKKYEDKKKQEIMNKIPGAVIIYDFDGKILYINDFVQRIFGYKKIDIINKSILMFISEKDKQRAISELKTDVKNKIIKNPIAHWTLIASDKREIDSIINFSYYDKKSVIAICMDNTQIIEAKKSYSQQVQFFWSLLNDIPMPLSYRDIDGVYKFVNLAFQKYMNIKEVDILGKKINFIIKKDEFDRFEEKRKLAINTKQEIIFEDISTIDNKKRILHFDIVPRIIDNETTGTFVTFKDITSEKMKENTLKREILLNKTINEILDIMISSNLETLENNINTVLYKIRTLFKADRVFILTMNNDKFSIKYESIGDGIKPHINHIFDMSEKESNFCKNIILNNEKITSNNISQLISLNHLKYLNAKSVAEVGIFINNEISGIVGIIFENKNILFETKDVNLLKSASTSMLGTFARIQQMHDFKLNEETLNTLIDNIKFGIIIIDSDNIVKFINEKACSLFDITHDEINNKKIELSKYVSDEYTEIIKKSIKEREYKEKYELNLKLKSNNLVELYSSKISFEGSKAYLITLMDINKYI